MHRVVPIAFLVVLLTGGCRTMPRWLGGGASSSSPHEPVTKRTADRQSPNVAPSGSHSTYQVHLSFDLIRANLPLGEIRDSRKLWNHVDELRAAPELVALLARNGLRIGVATPKDWPALRSVLIACDAKLYTDRIIPSLGLPLVVDLGSVDGPESVFAYGPDGQLVGKTFPAGNKLLNVHYAVRAELGGSVDLEASWEIRNDRGTMTWERSGGIIRQVPAYDRHMFGDVTVSLMLNPGEMLVVGTSAAADNEYLVGSRFLSGHDDAGPTETVLFITPVTYQSRRDQKGAG